MGNSLLHNLQARHAVRELMVCCSEGHTQKWSSGLSVEDGVLVPSLIGKLKFAPGSGLDPTAPHASIWRTSRNNMIRDVLFNPSVLLHTLRVDCGWGLDKLCRYPSHQLEWWCVCCIQYHSDNPSHNSSLMVEVGMSPGMFAMCLLTPQTNLVSSHKPYRPATTGASLCTKVDIRADCLLEYISYIFSLTSKMHGTLSEFISCLLVLGARCRSLEVPSAQLCQGVICLHVLPVTSGMDNESLTHWSPCLG